MAPSLYPEFYPEVLYVFIGFIVVTNAVIITAFFSNHRIRSNQANKHICSHAALDLLVGVVFIPCLLAEVGPLITGIMIMYSLLVSLLILTASSYDRYVAICRPLRYETIQTDDKVRNVLWFCWLFPIIVIVLPQFWLTDENSFVSIEHRVYLGVVVFGIMAILLVIVAAYFKIFMAGIKHLREQLVQREFDHWKNRLKMELKFARMFFMLSLTFFVFWIPTGYMTLVDNVLRISKPPIWLQELNFHWIFVSSFLNPMIYALFHQRFRRTIIMLLKYGKNPSTVVHPILDSRSQRFPRGRLPTEDESL